VGERGVIIQGNGFAELDQVHIKELSYQGIRPGSLTADCVIASARSSPDTARGEHAFRRAARQDPFQTGMVTCGQHEEIRFGLRTSRVISA